MEKKFPTWILAVIILTLFAVQGVATYWKLYFHILWLDIPMHLLGGFWLGLAVLAFYYASNINPKDRSRRFALVCALSFAFFIGLGWELFEWSVDQMNGLMHFDLVDTLSDLMNDIIGAAVAWVIFIRKGYNQ